MSKHRKEHFKANMASQSPGKRSETRLIIPPLTNRESSDASIASILDEWLIPQLLDEFLRERGITPKSQFFVADAARKVGR